MPDTLSTLLGPNDEPWTTSERDQKRQAIASLRGYAYQLHQSLAAWIALPDEAVLHLEISEDYSEIARDPATLEAVLTATQIKDTRESGSVTLNSEDVLDAIRNFWSLRAANSGRPVRLVFLTTSPLGQERKNPLTTGEKGLETWQRVAMGAPVDALRAALGQRFPLSTDSPSSDQALAAFISESDDETLRQHLIAPIRWACGAPDLAGIAADNRAALVVRGQALGGTPDLSARAADVLLMYVLTAILDGGDRRLLPGQLTEALYSAITVRVPAQLAISGVAIAARGLDLESTGAWRIAAVPKGRYAARDSAVAELRALTGELGGSWIHGATGLGKSMLAELAAVKAGGKWYVLDVRGAAGATARERIVAARSAILADRDVAGLIIDDLDPSLERDVETPLGELAQSLVRRQLPLIITSNNPPSMRLARVLGLADSAGHPVPSFDKDDVADLIAAYGGDPARWAYFAWVVGGGHPQLVDVVVAGLERRGWPESAMRDWMSRGLKNDDVEAEREAARRRLLAELAPETLTLLARTVRIYGVFDRPLAMAVGAVAPAVVTPGLSLDQLAGHWIERAGPIGLRPSALVSGLDREMLGEDLLKEIDLAIVTNIFTRGTVDVGLFDTAFFHAWLAQDESWINFMVQQVIQTGNEDRPKLASAVPLMREAGGDLGFLSERPYPVLLLRLAQHLLKSSIGTDEEVAASANKLLSHLDSMAAADGSFRNATAAIVLMKLLFDVYGHGRIPGWFGHLRRLDGIFSNDSDFRDLAERSGASSSEDPVDYLFVAHAAHLPGIAALEALFEELDELPSTERARWLKAMNDQPVAMSMIVDNAWLKDAQRETIDGLSQASTFERLAEMALAWNETRLAGRCYRAQALMLDEYAKDRDAAYTSLDNAEKRLPENFDIRRERGKISWRGDDYERAYQEIVSLEHRMSETEPYDAAFALREAAISAGETGRWQEAGRLFAEARQFALQGSDGELRPLSVGLGADAAVAQFRGGEKAAGARVMASVLEELAHIDPEQKLVARSVHLLVRHLILWMRAQDTPIEVDGEEAAMVAGAASNPDPKPALASLPLSPLAPAWMLLARVALDAGVTPNEILGWPGLNAARADPNMDSLIRFDLLATAIENASLDDFLRFVVPAIESFEHVARLGAAVSDFDPLKSATGAIPSLPAGALATGSPRDHMRTAAVALGLRLITVEPVMRNRLDLVRTSIEALVGQDVLPEWSSTRTHNENEGVSLVARYLSAVDRQEVLPVEAIFSAHLRSLEWARRSNHRDPALTGLRTLVQRVWREICQERRAILVSPVQNVPTIEQALTTDRPAASFIADVLLAAEPAVSIGLSTEFRALLLDLRDAT